MIGLRRSGGLAGVAVGYLRPANPVEPAITHLIEFIILVWPDTVRVIYKLDSLPGLNSLRPAPPCLEWSGYCVISETDPHAPLVHFLILTGLCPANIAQVALRRQVANCVTLEWVYQ
ncbi:hypothetical protein PoB_007474000 [Plakobranchus ocellatus]|uniref:Uncharacterized protein n=1 Tax=Plakobranchus ocellatus TaxID=259542 RepID=A0AAV4DVP9_9GAST|nr:hypothetical protein PoB_007474000 [Plakobranchus ocellatus]